jgi:predicted nucleic acid-binding protein
VGLIDDVGSGPVALDTCAFIYFVEEDERYVDLVAPIFERIDAGQLRAATSALTLLEVLAVPFRAGNPPLAERYEALLARGRGLLLVDMNRRVLRTAAQLRAQDARLRTPDAIQLASALVAGCTTLLTNDRRIADAGGVRVLQLRDYLASARPKSL